MIRVCSKLGGLTKFGRTPGGGFRAGTFLSDSIEIVLFGSPEKNKPKNVADEEAAFAEEVGKGKMGFQRVCLSKEHLEKKKKKTKAKSGEGGGKCCQLKCLEIQPHHICIKKKVRYVVMRSSHTFLHNSVEYFLNGQIKCLDK